MTKKDKFIVGIVLFFLGFLGILSILTMDIYLPKEAEEILRSKFSDNQIKLLLLINPSIILVISVIVGTILYKKVNLKLPIIEKLLGIKKESINFINILKYGVIGGVISGFILVIINYIFKNILYIEISEINNNIKPTLITRFLYGGFTEEILMRFGLMTFIIWLCYKINKKLTPYIYWLGIILSSVIFAIGHFPIVFQAIETPSINLIIYILIGNSIGGLFFGWLYWKKGLESSFIAHIFAHLILIQI